MGGALKLDRDKLIRAREMLGYGIETTAQEAGVSKNSVLRAEHEEDIRPVTARKIAAALDVRVADLLGESETLKAEASPLEPSFENVLEEERREAIYKPWLDYVEHYADRWEKRIEAGDFDMGNVNEFIATLEDLLPVLHELNVVERQGLPPQEFSFGVPAAKTGEAIGRLMDLLNPVARAYHEKFEEIEETAPAGATVTNLQEFRERVANMQHRAVG
jgi:DNA-binding XRE family transcriptional regulator